MLLKTRHCESGRGRETPAADALFSREVAVEEMEDGALLGGRSSTDE